MRTAAWVPSSAFSDPAAAVAGLHAARVAIANLMVNDYASGREAQRFTTFDVGKINAMARACRDGGIEVHLTSWIMPHDVYMDGALQQLPPLLASTGATLLVWDAESPWVKATGSFSYTRATEKAASIFPRLGLTGIGSAPVELCALANVCKVFVPQCYATSDSQATPGGVVPYSLGEWSERYGEPEEAWAVGLAAYDQTTPPTSTMQPPIDAAKTEGVTNVCYWTSNAIADDQAVCEFVAGLNPPTPVQHDGIFPTLLVESMPRSVRSQALAEVQALLQAWSIDGGPIDGLPGPKTIEGVVSFQALRGLPETAVVDGATWVALLRP
jgi:hypothetical protein